MAERQAGDWRPKQPPSGECAGQNGVSTLHPRENVWLDPTRIGALYAQMGGAEVQALLERAMIELGYVLDDLTTQFRDREMEGFARNLRRLRRIANHLGLSMLVRVADDVALCLERGDATALAATWARLSRNAGRAMAGGWSAP